MSKKLRMTLSLDLDNQWTYMKTHGNPAWESYPSYLDIVVPRILDFLEQRKIKITFFVVGQDAVREENHAALASLSAAGHEIANHSFNHEPWLHLYSPEQLNEELSKAEEAIEAVTGVRVKGFRGPGFSLSTSTLNTLKNRGYEYDATSLPNALNPVARWYFLSRSQLTDEQKKQRQALFGTFSDALRPNKPYRWNLDQGELLELPVTTMPLFKIPIHFSYLVYLGIYSRMLANFYTRFSIGMCRLTRTEPSLLLHPLDFMGREDNTGLEFFPAMGMSVDKKLELMDGFFSLLLRSFEPHPIGAFMDTLGEGKQLGQYEATFAHDKVSA